MLRGHCANAIRLSSRRTSSRIAKFSSSTCASSTGPNAPVDLDASLKELLRDADMALLNHRPRENSQFGSENARELEILEFDESWWRDLTEEDENEFAAPKERKSPRAKFGSRSIGSIFMPYELLSTIDKIIDESDKPRLHEDVKRLFLQDSDSEGAIRYLNFAVDYKSRKQALRHAHRDGTAFASVALPAHYSVIYAVFDNIKHRLGNEWKVQSVIDWGSGAGSGLWASMHAFRDRDTDEESCPGPRSDFLLSQSTVLSYIGIEKREALSSMAKRLVKEIDLGVTDVRWRRGYSDADRIHQSNGEDVIALSAFHLSSLMNDITRKQLVKQMWNSGAHVIALIDHDTSAGFASIAAAREQLLQLGRREEEDPKLKDNPASGCHVVAPCPHDGTCPLINSAKFNLRCSFSQRLQRPSFMRRTKHVSAGHEDIGYTYVVIRRCKRPSLRQRSNTDAASEQNCVDSDPSSIRLEAYDWPRMVFPPLKRSGHVILDGCTAEGKIMRMIIPKSQGKQPYYDARKSSWGDIFPHKPKNPPQVRVESKNKGNDLSMLQGSDIGKPCVKKKTQDPMSYAQILSGIKESNNSKRRSWIKSGAVHEDGQDNS